MTRGFVAGVLIVLVMGSACSESDAAVGDSLVSETDATTPAPSGSDRADIGAFCTEYDELGGERPESYVGSAEHLSEGPSGRRERSQIHDGDRSHRGGGRGALESVLS